MQTFKIRLEYVDGLGAAYGSETVTVEPRDSFAAVAKALRLTRPQKPRYVSRRLGKIEFLR
jgi:hypothetical protein